MSEIRNRKAKKKKKYKESDKLKDATLTDIENTINQIIEMYSFETRLQTVYRSKRKEFYLKFKLDKSGSETTDHGRIIIERHKNNSDIVYRLKFGFEINDVKNIKMSTRTELLIGKKIFINYIKDSNISNKEINNIISESYYDIPSTDIQSVLHDLMCKFSQIIIKDSYYYFKLCVQCFDQFTEPLNNSSIEKMVNNYDLYSRSCLVCEKKSSNLVTNNIVMDSYHSDPNIVKFLLLLSLNALDSTNRFTPYPVMYNKGKLIDDYSHSVKLFANISRDINYWILKLDTVDDAGDLKLNSILDSKNREYEFIKFVIESNKTILSYFDTQIGSNKSSDAMIRETDIWDNSDIIVFAVTHDSELEDRFNKVEHTTYLYHGSPSYNWHSILRNGLKNYSGSGKMTNGAAYGPGIYLSDSSSLSLGYSNRSIGNFNVIAIAQVIDAQTYNKKNSIYVVPDESKVLIKYLILTKNNHNIPNNIFKHLTIDLPRNLDHNRGCMVIIVEKRLNMEYTKIKNKIETIETNNKIEINESVTKLNNKKIDEKKDTELNTELDDLILKTRTWIIDFNDKYDTKIIVNISYQYPLVPPKIKIQSNYKLLGYITPLLVQNENSNDNTYIYKEPIMSHISWKPSIGIHSIIDFLIKKIIDYID
jgi:hypothetical protein